MTNVNFRGIAQCFNVVLDVTTGTLELSLVADTNCSYDEGKWSECDKLTNVRLKCLILS